MKDVVILVADKDAEQLLEGLFPRVPIVEQFPTFAYDIYRHPNHDAGVRTGAADFLRNFTATHARAFVIFDYEGCGMETVKTAIELEKEMESELVKNGWAADSVCVCCVDPEIENWVWVKSAKLEDLLYWEKGDIYEWLKQQDTPFNADGTKPIRPKETFDLLLEEQEEPHSSSLFKELAEKASYKLCQDRAFLKMREALRRWFLDS